MDITVKAQAGGAMHVNVVRYCSLLALSRGGNTITAKDLMDGIRKEFGKEGKIV